MTQQANGEGGRRSRGPQWLRRVPPTAWRRALWTAGVVVVLAGVLWLILPAAVGYAVEAWLRQQGAQRVEVGRVELGLWSARVQIERVESVAGGDAGLAFDRLAASFDLGPLFDRRVLVRELVIDGVRATVTRSGDGTWRVGGLSLGTGRRAADGWAFGVRALDLRNARIAFQAYGIEDSITVARLRLDNVISWDAADPLTLDADLGLGAASLGARGAVRIFGEDQTAMIEIDAAAVPLATFAPLAQRFGVFQLAGQARLKATISAAEGEAGPHVGFDGTLGLDGASARAGVGSFAAEGFEWRGVASLAVGVGAALEGAIEGRAALARFEGRAGEATLETGGIDWTGKWTMKRAAGQTAVDATGTGAAKGKALAFLAADDAGSLRLDAFRWNGRADLLVDPGRTLYGYLDGALALDRPRGEIRAGSTAATSAAWRGWISASRAGAQNDVGVVTRASVTAEDFVVRHAALGLEGQARSAGWNGHVELETWKGAPELYGSTDGRVTLREPVLDDSRRAVRLIAADSAVASDVFAGLRGDLFINELDIDSLRLLAPLREPRGAAGQPAVAAGNLFVDQLGLTAEGVRVGEVRIRDADLTVVRKRDGTLAMMDVLGAKPGTGRERPDAGQDGAAIVAVGPVRITGNSTVTAIDRAMRPPVRVEIAPFSLTMGHVNRLRPEADTEVALQATLKPHAKLAVSGTVRPFARRTTLRLSGKIESLDLAPLSPYAEKRLGFSLETGQLNGAANVKIDAGALDGLVKADARRLGVALRDPGAARALTSALPVSLQTALDLLRGEGDHIRVTVPVGGDIGDPQFDLSDTINRAIGRAIANTVQTTLKVLFPIGALASMVFDGGDKGALRFQPLGFAPGSAALDPPAQAYLDQLARLLAERPRIRVSLCGAATESDRRALAEAAAAEAAKRSAAPPREGRAVPAQPPGARQSPAPLVGNARLSRLAEARVDTVRRDLVERHAIDSERLASCRPSIDPAENARPRVDVTL